MQRSDVGLRWARQVVFATREQVGALLFFATTAASVKQFVLVATSVPGPMKGGDLGAKASNLGL